MENNDKNFLDSLDLPDEEMGKYIPFVLQDLWELGSIPEYIYQLIANNIDTKDIGTIIDFGCGKGAVLIYLANKFDFHGIGIDIVPEFISSAIQYAIENSVDTRLDFKTDDIMKYVGQNQKYDLVIYGYDSEVLGDVYTSFSQLKNNISESGYLILEIAFTPDNKERIEGLPGKKELLEQLEMTGLKIIDKIFWETNKIKTINNRNNFLINRRIQELKKIAPEKTRLFEQYMANQIKECKLIENDMVCSTWLLKK